LIDKINSAPKEVRKFGITMCVVLSLIAAYSMYREGNWWPYLFGGGGVFLLLGLIAVPLLRPVYIGWMRFAQVLAWFNTRLILGVFFYLILTPAGVIMRIFGKDPLSRKIDRNAKSYWILRPSADLDPIRYEQLF
jgi:hypothetical protein